MSHVREAEGAAVCSQLRGGGGRIEDPESWDPRGHRMSYRGFGAGETSREWTGLTCAYEAAVTLGFLSWFSASKSLLGLADARQDHHIPKPSGLQSDQGPPPLSHLTASFPYFAMTSVLFLARKKHPEETAHTCCLLIPTLCDHTLPSLCCQNWPLPFAKASPTPRHSTLSSTRNDAAHFSYSRGKMSPNSRAFSQVIFHVKN